MRITCFVPLCCSVVLMAQESSGKKAEPVPETKAAKPAPRKLTPPVADVGQLDLEAATKSAVQALLALQEGEGQDQWPYRGVYTEDSNPSPVGYRVGGTSIACLGLLAAPGYGTDKERQQALQRGLAFVLKTLDAPRMSEEFIGGYDVRGWGHIYALQFLLALQDSRRVPGEHAAAVVEKTTWLVATLVDSAIPETGGWNYSRRSGYLDPKNKASTFMTAPALQALFHAKARGHVVPDGVVNNALAALERARAKPGGYSYGAPATSMGEVEEEKLGMMDKTPSSAARASACETTLMLAGRGDPARLERAVDLFFTHWDELAVRKSQLGTHVPKYGIAPYYFLYGHVYAAQAIEQIADPVKRGTLREKLRAVLAKCREEDGSWNDRQFDCSAGYGTALALLALHMPHLPKPLAWQPGAAAKK
ncbi:MAG: prenyltransferase/squalene oxidase repeat-containing protein [Planctomycetota bacterium]